MNDLEKLTKVFDELKIEYTKTEHCHPNNNIEIFLHESNFTFVFSNDGEYVYYDACYD